MKPSTLTLSLAAVSVLALSGQALAETVTTQTYVKNKPLPGVNLVDFSTFDVNHDGAFSMPEVGERLFQSYDTDENGHIDNIEWDSKNVLTISPMEKETFQYIDYDNDGYTDEATYTYETFYQASGLIRFDKNQDGLTAEEFIGKGYQALDKDDDNLISLDEWKSGYIASLKPETAEQERYN